MIGAEHESTAAIAQILKVVVEDLPMARHDPTTVRSGGQNASVHNNVLTLRGVARFKPRRDRRPLRGAARDFGCVLKVVDPDLRVRGEIGGQGTDGPHLCHPMRSSAHGIRRESRVDVGLQRVENLNAEGEIGAALVQEEDV